MGAMRFSVFCLVVVFGILVDSKPFTDVSPDASSGVTTSIKKQDTTVTTENPASACGGVVGFFHVCPSKATSSAADVNSSTLSSNTGKVPERNRRNADDDVSTEWSTESSAPDSSEEVSSEPAPDQQGNLGDSRQERDTGDVDPQMMSGLDDDESKKNKRSADSNLGKPNIKGKREAVPDEQKKVLRSIGEDEAKKGEQSDESGRERRSDEENDEEEDEKTKRNTAVSDDDSDGENRNKRSDDAEEEIEKSKGINSSEESGENDGRKRRSDNGNEKIEASGEGVDSLKKSKRSIESNEGRIKKSEEVMRRSVENGSDRRKRDEDGDDSDYNDSGENEDQRKKREAGNSKKSGNDASEAQNKGILSMKEKETVQKNKRDVPPLGGSSPTDITSGESEDLEKETAQKNKRDVPPLGGSSPTDKESGESKDPEKKIVQENKRDVPPLGGSSPTDMESGESNEQGSLIVRREITPSESDGKTIALNDEVGKKKRNSPASGEPHSALNEEKTKSTEKRDTIDQSSGNVNSKESIEEKDKSPVRRAIQSSEKPTVEKGEVKRESPPLGGGSVTSESSNSQEPVKKSTTLQSPSSIAAATKEKRNVLPIGGSSPTENTSESKKIRREVETGKVSLKRCLKERRLTRELSSYEIMKRTPVIFGN